VVTTLTDDLGLDLALVRPCDRVVSLVPSLTESVASVRREALVGATDWCTHPADLDVTRVRGTKNPDLAKILALQPDIVLANQEENRRVDVERLRAAGIQVWVSVVESVPQALTSLRRIFERALGWEAPAWLDEADDVWAAGPARNRMRVVVPVWRDPWIVVGARTFAGDLLMRLGIGNAFAGAAERYPHVTMDEIVALRPHAIVLPDEPYRFTVDDGPEVFPNIRSILVEGRALTWYGPSLVSAAAVLGRALHRDFRP
jgi:ABC-type Fe3+-hydroxamate transport system substrate-binding protein